MFLRCSTRRKDGKEHLYWSIVENRRVSDGRVVQRHVLYLGELNGVQEAAWRKTVAVFAPEEEGLQHLQQVALFPEEHAPAEMGAKEFPIVRLRLAEMALRRPRQWGACWLGCQLWAQLGLDRFWGEKLPVNREGTPWARILQTLVLYRLIAPGSEWRLHRQWFEHPGVPGLGGDFALAEIHKLYRCHDRLLVHKAALEQAFKELKGDLAVRPIFHQLERRVEAHIFIAFLAYCLHVTLKARLQPLASGLTPRAVLEKVRCRANARRAPAHDRRARDCADPLYPARERPPPPARPTQAHVSRTSSTQNPKTPVNPARSPQFQAPL